MALESWPCKFEIMDGEEHVATVTAFDEHASSIEIKTVLDVQTWGQLYWAVHKALKQMHGGINE